VASPKCLHLTRPPAGVLCMITQNSKKLGLFQSNKTELGVRHNFPPAFQGARLLYVQNPVHAPGHNSSRARSKLKTIRQSCCYWGGSATVWPVFQQAGCARTGLHNQRDGGGQARSYGQFRISNRPGDTMDKAAGLGVGNYPEYRPPTFVRGLASRGIHSTLRPPSPR